MQQEASVPWLAFLCAQEGSSAREKIEFFIKNAKLTAPVRAALRNFGSVLDKEVKAIEAPMKAAVEEAQLLSIYERLRSRGSPVEIEEVRRHPEFWTSEFVDRLDDIDRRVGEIFPSAAFDRIKSIMHP